MKLDLSEVIGFESHRSGWGYCMNSLKKYHSKSGILVDSFIEKTFAWNIVNNTKLPINKRPPYKRSWIGFLHNPPNIPSWFDYCNSPDAILNRDTFKESLKTCLCIVVLSDYLKKWLEQKINVPIIVVKHPTETIVKKWKYELFIKQKKKQVVQIGYWLRKLDSIFNLNTTSEYGRMWLPGDKENALNMLDIYGRTKLKNQEVQYKWAGINLTRLSNEEYDDLMTHAVAFLDLYDSSANNAVIEPIARNTPILVNKLEPVVEYLGEDYPLYFKDLDHAAYLLKNKNNILSAHKYLKNMNKDWISGTYFANDLVTKLEKVIK